MEAIGKYKDYDIVKGTLAGKPCIGGGSVQGMNNTETANRIFVHIGQKFKSTVQQTGKPFCMDSWAPEPAGWVVEYPSCFMTVDAIDGQSSPYGLIHNLAEEHAITRLYDAVTGFPI